LKRPQGCLTAQENYWGLTGGGGVRNPGQRPTKEEQEKRQFCKGGSALKGCMKLCKDRNGETVPGDNHADPPGSKEKSWNREGGMGLDLT